MKKAVHNATTGQIELIDMTADEVAVMNASHAANAPKAAAVKAEARRRILARYPEWKQANLMARGVALVRKGETQWTAEELTEANSIHAVWDWIKAVRAASNSIEAMTPIPDDFQDDKCWPK